MENGVWPTHERRKVSERSQGRDPTAGWGLPRRHIIDIFSPRTRCRVLVGDKAHLDDTGDPCSSKGVTKYRVDHCREHQGLGVSAERPSGDCDSKMWCKLCGNPCTSHTLVRELRSAAYEAHINVAHGVWLGIRAPVRSEKGRDPASRRSTLTLD